MMREEPAFKIKNATLPLLVLHVNTTDMDRLKSELEARLNQTPDFFSDTPMALALAGIAESGATPDFAGLVTFMREHGMRATGIVGGSPEQRQAAVEAGLGLFPEAHARPAPVPEPETHVEPHVEESLPVQPELPGIEPAIPEPVQAASVPDTQAVPEATPPEQPRLAPSARPTVIVDKPVRTGQRIYAKGADLVVLAMVNAGAEIIADGDIHIYAPLRGRALAGAHGNEDARIFVQRLEAELISIAGCFQVFENGIPENVRGKPAQIRLDGSRLLLQPLPA